MSLVKKACANASTGLPGSGRQFSRFVCVLSTQHIQRRKRWKTSHRGYRISKLKVDKVDRLSVIGLRRIPWTSIKTTNWVVAVHVDFWFWFFSLLFLCVWQCDHIHDIRDSGDDSVPLYLASGACQIVRSILVRVKKKYSLTLRRTDLGRVWNAVQGMLEIALNTMRHI